MRVIVDNAIKALIHEAALTPKPGLVDALDTGAHTDMDFTLFIESAFSFRDSFEAYYLAGYQNQNDPIHVFNTIRQIGIMAENKMFETTHNVNTHKGANFSFGIVLAAIGACDALQTPSLNDVVAYIKRMTCGLTSRELYNLEHFTTHGERMFKEYGILGIRGEVEHGFPLITDYALPYLKNHSEHPIKERLLGTLLVLMVHNDDSNILKRGGIDALDFAKHEASRILALSPVCFESEITLLNQQFIEKNLSPGGSADLLALTIFLGYHTQTL